VSKLFHWSGSLPGKAAHVLVPGGGVLVAASAAAAVAWREIEARRVTGADLPDKGMKIETLRDMRADREQLLAIETALIEEWGQFGLLGFRSAAQMAAVAGDSILIASEREGDRYRARGALQTVLVPIGGDAAELARLYPSFQELTQPRSWRLARRHGGDTIVLLQITTFGSGGRGAGLGSLLRNAALHIQDRSVRYALTMTPVDGDAGKLDLGDPATYTPAMRFHARGGAEPVLLLPGYKAGGDETNARHGPDVVVMRYLRAPDGSWPAPRPRMRVHSAGPIQDRVSRTARGLAAFPSRGRGALQRLRRGAGASRRRLALLRPLRRRDATREAA
jgi:hypothetical protein